MTESESEGSLWGRPGFIASAVLVMLVVVVGVVLTIMSLNSKEPAPVPTSTPAPTEIPSAPIQPDEEASICGLSGVQSSGTVSIGPEAEWAYLDTMAYPSSEDFGPGDTSVDGVRFCFQRSPEGALFAAANAVVQGNDPTIGPSWIEYFLSSDTPGRQGLVDDVGSSGSSSGRTAIAGFRVLSYNAESASIEMVIRSIGSGNTVYGSAIYRLVWESGDWKLLPRDMQNPLEIAQLPDLAGYVSWGVQ